MTVLSPVRAVKGKGHGYGACLACFRCREHVSCGKKQEPPVHLSREHPTELACLQELRKRLHDPSRHAKCAEAFAKKAAAAAASAATVSPNTPNVLQAMVQLEQAKTVATNFVNISLAYGPRHANTIGRFFFSYWQLVQMAPAMPKPRRRRRRRQVTEYSAVSLE